MRYYNRRGESISIGEWMRLVEDHEYHFLAKTNVDGALVSTVWLGIDHNFSGEGSLEIFETMVFGGSWDEDYMARYATEEAAMDGHECAVLWVRNRIGAVNHG